MAWTLTAVVLSEELGDRGAEELMARSGPIRAADRGVLRASAAAWITISTFGAFWAFPRVEESLDRESAKVESLAATEGATVEWNGRDGYLQVFPGTENAEQIAADLRLLKGSRDVEIAFVGVVTAPTTTVPAATTVAPTTATPTTTAPGLTTASPTTVAPTTTASTTATVQSVETEGLTVDANEVAQTTQDELDKVFALQGIEFIFATATPTAETETVIDNVARILEQHPEVDVAIEGHTDSSGSGATNQALSERRANAIMAGLVDRGIAPSRLTAAGFGGSDPIESNETSDGRQRNRRVEIMVK